MDFPFIYSAEESRRIFNFLSKSWVKFVKTLHTHTQKYFVPHSSENTSESFHFGKVPSTWHLQDLQLKPPRLDQQQPGGKFTHTHIDPLKGTSIKLIRKSVEIILIKKHRKRKLLPKTLSHLMTFSGARARNDNNEHYLMWITTK